MIHTVTAVDADVSSANNEISYSVISGDYGMFSVDPDNGEVSVARMLDRESERQEYSLVISAVDNGQPVLSSQQTLTITV